MNVMVTGLHGGKMSSSHPSETKIEFLDDPETVCRKIEQIQCEPDDIHSTVLLLLRDIIIPISQQRLESLRDTGTTWEADSNDKPRPFVTGDAPEGAIFSIPMGPTSDSRHYASFIDIQNGFISGAIGPKDLKSAVSDAFNKLLAPIRAIYTENKEWQTIDKFAYPE